MADGIYIDFSDLLKTEKLLPSVLEKIKDDVDEILSANALEIEATSKRLAPKDESRLAQSITANVSGFLEKEINVGVFYAAYIEFGTGKFAASYVSTLPQDWQQFASKFKGKSAGGFDEFLEKIYRWVKRKQIGYTYNVKTKRRDRVGKQTAEQTDRATAYYIAIRIIQNGVRPHPFLYPAYEQQRKQIIEDATNFLKSLKV